MSPSRPSSRQLARRLARRAVGALPAPRDQAASRLLSSARDLVRGTPGPAAGPAPAGSRRTRPARPAAPPAGLPGHWLRVVSEPGARSGIEDREPTDRGVAAAVRSGWLLVDAHERLSTRGARAVFSHELDAWQRYADESIAPMASVESGQRTWEIQESPGNRVRYRRTIDFALPGDRVFDVGFGRGYLAAVLLRDRGVASYRGIEILDDKVDGTRDLFRANDLDDSSVFLEQGDLYDLTRASIGEVDFVICCEVLEHVPDPEKALRVMADALPEGADLLFTLPMAGRLEQVWGHASVFDVARVKQMLDGAGLVAHHVEPMANTWTLVVASRDPESSGRVLAALGRPPERVSQPLVNHREFVDVPAGEIAALTPGSAVTPAPQALETRPSLPPPRSVGQTVLLETTGQGGLVMAVIGLEAARLKIGFLDATHVQRVVTIGRVGDREVCRWTWTPSGSELAREQSRRWLRPGESGPGILAGRHERLGEVDHLEVLLEQPDDAAARLWVAVAYLP